MKQEYGEGDLREFDLSFPKFHILKESITQPSVRNDDVGHLPQERKGDYPSLFEPLDRP